MSAAPELTSLLRATVQDVPDAKANGGMSVFNWGTQRGPLLPAWGTRERERALQAYYRHNYSTLIQGAFSGLAKRWAATPWEISGPPRATKRFQDVFRQADFGAGWGTLISKVALDFLRYDGGAYVEVIAPGNPMKAPTGPVLGLAALDSLRCFPTGDPQYPVVYTNRKGTMHLMHRTRVLHFVDMPDADMNNPGYGLSALSRSIAIANRQILMGRYIEQALDDNPSPGFALLSGLSRQKFNEAFQAYRTEQGGDMRPEWGRIAWLVGLQPENPVTLEFVPFSKPPEAFDRAVYTELDVNELALAIGVDKQELWELGSGDLGSGAQSEVLHAKSQGKMFGAFLTMLERAFNDVLPDTCEFTFKVQDPYEVQERAQTASLWAGVVQVLGDRLTPDEVRLLLANQIEAVKDAISDASGEIARLNDADPKGEPQPPEVTAVDNTPLQDDATPPGAAQDVTADDADGMLAAKAVAATRLDFENDFEALLDEARAGRVDRRRFPILMRSIIRRQSLKAYRDGLIDGGVADGALDDDDNAAWASLYADASNYVRDFWKSLFDGAGISDAQAAQRPGIWWNKSLQPFYTAGRASADKNGAYEWVLGQTEAHCPHCLMLNGQVHRLRDYVKSGWLPQADKLACGGFQCDCKLVKSDQKARGRFPSGAEKGHSHA